MPHPDSWSSSDVRPDRLLAAADAILASAIGEDAGRVAWAGADGVSREGFTSHELVEAMLFLWRLDLVDLDLSGAEGGRDDGPGGTR